jgi:uncharacterized protein (UPF0332 family)
MPRFAPPKHLLRVGKGTKAEIDRWKEGSYLEGNTGKTIQELAFRAAADRFALAATFLRQAKRLNRDAPGLYRSAVSRCYYSMYHAMRAAVYVVHGGDDFQEHKVLPGNAPVDLTDHAVWSNALKSARERRNAADYDPYPKSESSWRSDAVALESQASNFLREVKSYLKGKGCAII